MSKIFWDRLLQHLQFTDVEVGRRTAQVQSQNVIEIFPCDRTQIVMSFGVAECFWDLRSSPAKKLWNMTNSASSTLRSLLFPLALSQIFFCTTCRLSRALQASRGKSGHGSVEGDWEEYWREIFVWSGAEGMNTTPQPICSNDARPHWYIAYRPMWRLQPRHLHDLGTLSPDWSGCPMPFKVSTMKKAVLHTCSFIISEWRPWPSIGLCKRGPQLVYVAVLRIFCLPSQSQ